jgi:hypothetical protein
VSGDADEREPASLADVIELALTFYAAIVVVWILIIAALPAHRSNENDLFSPQDIGAIASALVVAPSLVVALVGSGFAVAPMRRRHRRLQIVALGTTGVGLLVGSVSAAFLTFVVFGPSLIAGFRAVAGH